MQLSTRASIAMATRWPEPLPAVPMLTLHASHDEPRCSAAPVFGIQGPARQVVEQLAFPRQAARVEARGAGRSKTCRGASRSASRASRFGATHPRAAPLSLPSWNFVSKIPSWPPTCQIGSHRAAVPRAWHPHSACTQALPRPLSTPPPRAAKAPRNEEAPRQPTPASDRTSRRDRATRLLGNNAASACIPRPPIVCDAEVQGV